MPDDDVDDDLGGDLDDAEVATEEQVAAGPDRPELDSEDPLTKLQANVRSALASLPASFQFDQQYGGIEATDLHNLNTMLGAGIETEVVRTLTGLRSVWDPDAEWTTYSFERSSQSFPDVRLVSHSADGDHVALGIELKGWWMLAKEGVPSMRYQVAPAACAPHDLICVVPWYLRNAVAGQPVAAQPWIESARYAAEWRDFWWTTVRNTDAPRDITYPENAHPYPEKADEVLAVPAYDKGKNLGRLPRCKPLMDAFVESTMAHPILGIEARAWVAFLSQHRDRRDRDEIATALQKQLRRRDRRAAPEQAEAIMEALDELRDLLPEA